MTDKLNEQPYESNSCLTAASSGQTRRSPDEEASSEDGTTNLNSAICTCKLLQDLTIIPSFFINVAPGIVIAGERLVSLDFLSFNRTQLSATGCT